MKQKLSNLEAYYMELQDDNAQALKPYSKLSNIEKYRLEMSIGFRSFLRRNIWTEILMYSFLAIIAVVAAGIYLS